MTADVNVTEKMARAKAASHDRPVYTIDYDDARTMLSALADPEVLAGIAGVLREHDIEQVDGRLYCWTCHTTDPLHVAAAVVEWLRGEQA